MLIALSLGSNLAKRMRHLVNARRHISALPDTRVLAASAVYETEPVDVAEEFRDQAFLNAALLLESCLPTKDLAHRLHGIETELGRVRSADRNAPRAIDIDIIAAGAEHFSSTELTVPHPRWSERRFVVQPLADVCPEWVLPGEDLSVQMVLDGLPDRPVVRLFRRAWEEDE